MSSATQVIPFAMPGPPPTLIGRMGNLFLLNRDPLGHMGELFKRYGRVTSLVAGGGTRIFSTDPHCPGTVLAYGPDHIHAIETQPDVFHKYALSGRLYPTGEPTERVEPLRHFATGLFSMNGEKHRRHRRMLQPAFHKQQIENYHQAIVEVIQSELDGWQPGQRRDIHQDLLAMTLRIVVRTMFGTDAGQAAEIGYALQHSLKFVVDPFVIMLPYDVPGMPYHRFLNLLQRMYKGFTGMIASKRAQAVHSNDLLSTLLLIRDEQGTIGLSESEVLDHAGVVFAAGHETSGNSLSWTLFLLSQHPRFAADLLTELNDLLHGQPPTPEQLDQVPLLELTIRESMRILPPVVWNSGLVVAPTEMGGYPLPVGTEVLASIYHTHHMPDLYEQPEVFNPYRWLSIQKDLFEYNPFGGGPRMCIGAPFAMLVMKTALAMILQRYRLEFIPGTSVDRFVGITMSFRNGLPMMVRAQDGRFEEGVGGVRGNVREMVDLAPPR